MILCLSDLWAPFPGGAERLIFNITRYLGRAGFEIAAVTGYQAAQRFDGPPVRYLEFGPERDVGGRILTDLLEMTRPAVILTHHYYAHRFERELVDSGIPLVQVVLNGRRIEQAAVAVYISQWTRETSGGAQPQDLVLTPPAFADVMAERHGDAVGFVKPIPHKGVDLIYRIARAMPDRHFVILRGEWQDLEVIRQGRNIEFMEPVVDMREFYARCRLLLVPSWSEDAGTVAQEATVNGLPCISSNVGGLAETNRGGVLLDPRDLRGWLRAIRMLDRADQYAATVRSQTAHLVATDHLGTLDLLVDRIRSLLPEEAPRTPA